MNRYLVSLALVGLLFCALASPLIAADPRIATISIQGVLDKSQNVSRARAQIRAEAEKHEAVLQQEQKKLEALLDEVEKKQAVWSAEVRAQRERELRTRYQEFELRREDAQRVVAQLEQRLMEPILRELDSIIAELGKKNNYHLILESTAPGLRSRSGLLYAGGTLDISDKVLVELNRRLK